MLQLFESALQDVYDAERQFLKAAPRLSEAATDPMLIEAIESHRSESEGHVQRLEKIARKLEIAPSGRACKTAQGLVEDAKELLADLEPGPTLDAGIAFSARKFEQYEIGVYAALANWANGLGLTDAIASLNETLEEEKSADATLLDVAWNSLNPKAFQPRTGEGGAFLW
jgi:ferritin-like metal-binding protein YciE